MARGVQDCARALACLADRLDGLERRLDAVAVVDPPAADHRLRPAPATPHGLEARVRALEGMSADRLQGFDQRLRKVESLSGTVSRLSKDTAWLTDLATTQRLHAAAGTREDGTDELTPIYHELDGVAELVTSHHVAATQSLERVRTLERAVLEMRRHLERSLSDTTRAAMSEQSSAGARIEAIEARLSALERP